MRIENANHSEAFRPCSPTTDPTLMVEVEKSESAGQIGIYNYILTAVEAGRKVEVYMTREAFRDLCAGMVKLL